MTSLDLNKFPKFENVDGLLVYNPFKEFPELINLGHVSQRIYGCAEFIGCNEDNEHPCWLENATLRAFLSEFSSLNEMLKESQDQRMRNISIEKGDYPLFHFLKLLRNVNFHVKSISGARMEFHARLFDKKKNVAYGDTMKLTRYIIADCNLGLLQNARDIRHYDESDIQKTLDWVNFYQMEQGIPNILEETLRQFCELIQLTVTDKNMS